MVTLTRKKKITITAIVALAIALIITVPFVSAQTTSSDPVTNTRTFKAQGNAYLKIDSSTIKYYPASFSLTVQPTTTSGTVRKFNISGGTVTVNGVNYAVTSGNGGVAIGKHLVLLQAQAAGPDGQPATLKLEGQYFWLWGQVYAVRMAARLQTGNDNYTLLMRAGIGV